MTCDTWYQVRSELRSPGWQSSMLRWGFFFFDKVGMRTSCLKSTFAEFEGFLLLPFPSEGPAWCRGWAFHLTWVCLMWKATNILIFFIIFFKSPSLTSKMAGPHCYNCRLILYWSTNHLLQLQSGSWPVVLERRCLSKKALSAQVWHKPTFVAFTAFVLESPTPFRRSVSRSRVRVLQALLEPIP